jgi:hypothetical protein
LRWGLLGAARIVISECGALRSALVVIDRLATE